MVNNTKRKLSVRHGSLGALDHGSSTEIMPKSCLPCKTAKKSRLQDATCSTDGARYRDALVPVAVHNSSSTAAGIRIHKTRDVADHTSDAPASDRWELAQRIGLSILAKENERCRAKDGQDPLSDDETDCPDVDAEDLAFAAEVTEAVMGGAGPNFRSSSLE